MHALVKTPAAFRQSIDQRLRNTGDNVERGRQLIAYERFLARLFETDHGDVRIVLKGGLALEIRMVGARSTRDVDVTMFSAPDDLLTFLRERVALGDGSMPPDSWFSFEVERDARRPASYVPGDSQRAYARWAAGHTPPAAPARVSTLVVIVPLPP